MVNFKNIGDVYSQFARMERLMVQYSSESSVNGRVQTKDVKNFMGVARWAGGANAEFTEYVVKNIANIDTNGDNVLTRREVARFAQEQFDLKG